MRRAFVIILDGLRRDFVSPERTPCLSEFATVAACFEAHRSVFPSATRAVSAAFATGCHPASNGLQGNTVALFKDGRLAIHDVGRPDFFECKRSITGKSLARPTLAERLSGAGGAVIFNNVSPGAAYAHDPDGFGTVYHRAGSRGPRFKAVAEPLDIAVGIEGDEAMAERFVTEMVKGEAALGVLWLSEPDTTQHAVPLGSPEHLEVLRRADAIAGRVGAAIEAMGGDDLVMVMSDHGHQTVDRIIDIDAFLVEQGLKEAGSDRVLVAPNGTAALIYVHPDDARQIPLIRDALKNAPWVGAVFCGDDLASVGQAPVGGLALAVSLAASDAPNAFGVAGTSVAAQPLAGKPDRLGCGQHGGLGTFEQAPFLMIRGRGFPPGTHRRDATSVVDLAPTILSHLAVPFADLDGRELQTFSEPHGDLQS